MLSRSICIVMLIVLVGGGRVPLLAPVGPAWLMQDRLVAQIYEAAYRPWPFNEWSGSRQPRRPFHQPGKRTRPRWQASSGSGTSQPHEGAGGRAGRQTMQPPGIWPEHLLDLMDETACRRVIRQVRWEQGLVCPHCGSPHVEVLVGQFTSAGWRYACQVCQTARGHPKRFSDLTGTLWESSHPSPAQLLVSSAAFVEGRSAEELARQTGVQPRIGQRMRRLYQVVLHLNRPDAPLDADVEIDEVYVISGWKGRPGAGG
jgi:transposase-like protein